MLLSGVLCSVARERAAEIGNCGVVGGGSGGGRKQWMAGEVSFVYLSDFHTSAAAAAWCCAGSGARNVLNVGRWMMYLLVV